jgi:hypothetical protein
VKFMGSDGWKLDLLLVGVAISLCFLSLLLLRF